METPRASGAAKAVSFGSENNVVDSEENQVTGRFPFNRSGRGNPRNWLKARRAARERSPSVSPRLSKDVVESPVTDIDAMESSQSRAGNPGDVTVLSSNEGLASTPLGMSQGYYDNYDEMKEHLSRHPKTVSSGGVTVQRSSGNDNAEHAISMSNIKPVPSSTAADVHHITERDVHAYFEGMGARSKLETTKHVAKHVGVKCIGSKAWWKRLAKQTFPIIGVCKAYKWSYLLPDMLAGLSTGMAAIPIGMSYASLANFSPEHGLYCQLFYAAVYMFFGTGQQVCVGTSAVEAMLTAGAVSTILGPSPTTEDRYNASYGLAFFVGIFLTVMRFLGLGVVSSFLADSVVSGFSTGCAVTIAASQLKHLFGIKMSGQLRTPGTVWYIISHIHESHWICLVTGGCGICLLIILNYLNRTYLRRFPIPSSLSFMTVFILFGFFLRIDKEPYSVPVVGVIPPGLPKPVAFNFDSSLLGPIAQQALWYSVVYYFIHISVAKSMAQKHDYAIDYDQELLATGIGSIVGSFFQCYPIATSIARTSICDGAGGITQLFNILNVASIFITITVLTPLLYYLPWAALASVVFFGVYRMMYFGEALRLLKLFSFDFLLWFVSFAVTIIWGAKEGIVTSIALSLIWIVKENAFPATAVLGRLPGTKVFRNIRIFPEAQEVRGCKILRFDASLNFSNADHFEKKILQLIGSPSSVARGRNDGRLSTTSALVESSPSFRKTPQIPSDGQQLRTSVDDLKAFARQATGGSRSGVTSDTFPADRIPAAESSLSCSSTITAAINPMKLDSAAAFDGENDDHRVRVVIIDTSSVNHVDVTAIRMLKNVAKKLESHNIVMLFANWKGPMRGFLEKARFYDTIPPDHCFFSIHDAVLWAEVFYLRRDPSVVQEDTSVSSDEEEEADEPKDTTTVKAATILSYSTTPSMPDSTGPHSHTRSARRLSLRYASTPDKATATTKTTQQ